MNRRRPIALAVAAMAVFSACGSTPPPAAELGIEMVNTLDVSDAVKDCMIAEFEDFELSEEDAVGFEDFDDVAAKAANGQDRALEIMAEFQAALTACN